MVWWLFRKKRDDDVNEKFVNLHESLHNSFSNIKRDMGGINRWLDHFKNKHENHDKKFDLLNQRINNIEEVIDGIQTAVQTGGLSKQVQTDNCPNICLSMSKQDEEDLPISKKLKKLTLMERAVVWALLNTDLKLSYEDLRVALGKDKSTLRGQINNIKSKSEGLIEEYPENDGTKRFCISEKIKREILKEVKKKETIQTKVKKVKSEDESNS